MRKLCGIVLIIIGMMMVYSIPEMIFSLWSPAREITTAQTFLLTIIASMPIIAALSTGLIFLLD